MSLRWRPLAQEVGKGESLDGGPEHRRVEVEHLDDPGVLLGVVGRQQLGRHLGTDFTIEFPFNFITFLVRGDPLLRSHRGGWGWGAQKLSKIANGSADRLLEMQIKWGGG